MKNKSALSMYLQRFQLLKKELKRRKKEVSEERDRLTRLYKDTLTRISTRTEKDRNCDQQTGNRNDVIKDQDGTVDVVEKISLVFERAAHRLRDMVAFLEAKSKELLRIKRTFQNEYPIMVNELLKRDLATEDDVDRILFEDLHRKKDVAVHKMTERLEIFRQSVNQRLDAEYGWREIEELLSKLNMTDGVSMGRSRPQTKLPLIVVSPQGTLNKTSGPRRSSSVSKDRFLSKAKQLRAAKDTRSSSNGASILTSTHGRSFSATGHTENGDGSKTSVSTNLDSSQEKGDKSSLPSKIKDGETQNGSLPVFDSKAQQTENIQVQEITSSVQDRFKGEAQNSFGESLTESSIMTSSTVSALLGDSSLQTSAASSDHSDIKPTTGSDSSVDSMTPSVAEEGSGDDHKYSAESVPKHREALLSRPMPAKGGSRYIQIGLPEPRSAWEGPQDALEPSARSNRPPYSFGPRGGQPSSGHYLLGPYSSRRNIYRRSQSLHTAYRQPGYQVAYGYYPAPPYIPRRSQSSQPVYHDSPRASISRGVERQNRLTRREVVRPGAVPCSGQWVASWPREGVSGRRNGVSSMGSPSSSGSPSPENESNRCDEDLRVNRESEVNDEGMVTVKLVTKEHVHKHRGPGLLDHCTQTDCFLYSQDKTLDDLTEFVRRRLKVNCKGRFRLWLFEEDKDGLFLPRRMLRGGFTKRTVGSLNLTTLTLFVQLAEPRERLYAFDHNKVRFVFVKAPHWDTGEFVVKGHHHVDITKATRAIIQVLRKKFMPQCPSSLRLYIEKGGKKMYCISHSTVSTFNEDTEGKSRHGDILVLLEDFIDQQNVLGDTSYFSQSQRDGKHLVPLAPQSLYQQACSKDSEGATSCSESAWTSDDQDDSPVCASLPSPRHDNGDLVERYRLHQNGDRTVQDHGRVTTETPQPKTESLAAISSDSHVSFIIPFDSTISTSDESLSSPVGDANNSGGSGSHQSGGAHGRQLLQWNLTNNYMSRFSRIKEEEGESDTEQANTEDSQQVGVVVKEKMIKTWGDLPVPEYRDSNVESVEYDSVDVSSSGFEMASVEYESLVVSSVGGEMLAQSDQDTSSGTDVLAVDTGAANVHTTQVSKMRSSIQLTTDPQLVPPALLVAENGQDIADIAHRLKECTVSVTSTEVTSSQNKLVVATMNLSEKKLDVTASPRSDGGVKTGSNEGALNPIAPTFTPRTRIRMQQLRTGFAQHNLADKPSGAQGDQHKVVVGNVREDEKDPRTVVQDSHAASFSPNTPRSGMSSSSVFTSDEDMSVYYTPGPAFVFPDSRQRLQSTAIPLSDTNHSDSPSQMNPDQISAITNCSSSFMAIRVPRAPSGGMEQISAIPNISTSFMEIPTQHQLHNSSLPGHSTSISQRLSSSSYRHEPSFAASVSPRQLLTHVDTSHLQANCVVLPCPMKPSSRQSLYKRRKSSKQLLGNDGTEVDPTVHVQSEACPPTMLKTQADGEENSQSCVLPKSEANEVKEEDPAIMDIGKQVMVIAQKSSLNANATEFVPKELPAARVPQGLDGAEGFAKAIEHAANQAGPLASPFHQNGRPLATKFYKCTTFSQQNAGKAFCQMGRTSVPILKPVAYPPTPVKVTSSSLYDTLRRQSARPLTNYGAKMPIIVSLTDGSCADLAPKPRPDTSRHVTFADPPIRNLKPGARHSHVDTNDYNPGHKEYAYAQASHSMKPAHPALRDVKGSNLKQKNLPFRRKIGSGRFDDRPKRYSEEFRKSAQRDAPHFRPQPAGHMYNHAQHNYRKYPTFHSKAYTYYGDSMDNGKVGRYGQVYMGPQAAQKKVGLHGRRDETGARMNGEWQSFHPRQWTDHHRSDLQMRDYPYNYPPGSAYPRHSSRFLPEETWYPYGHLFQTHPKPFNSYRQPKSSLKQSQSGEARERDPERGCSSGVSLGTNFRFRRPIRAQNGSNTSSDQSDTSLHNGRSSNPRFRRVNRPANESETETSLGSETFHSETSHSNDSIAEPFTETTAAGTLPAEHGSSGDSSDTKTSQSSTSSRQSMHVRRGYIQIGLGNGTCPTAARAVSDF